MKLIWIDGPNDTGKTQYIDNLIKSNYDNMSFCTLKKNNLQPFVENELVENNYDSEDNFIIWNEAILEYLNSQITAICYDYNSNLENHITIVYRSFLSPLVYNKHTIQRKLEHTLEIPNKIHKPLFKQYICIFYQQYKIPMSTSETYKTDLKYKNYEIKYKYYAYKSAIQEAKDPMMTVLDKYQLNKLIKSECN